MTRAEALRELGLETGATPDEIRRAYLRGVKARKPEVDPEGFRRLREAYELLTQSGRSAAGAEAPPGETVQEDPLQRWIQSLLTDLGAAADAPARIEILRRAAAERPDLPALRWRLAGELSAAGQADEAAAVLRHAAAAGMPGFLDELARSFPDLLNPSELSRLGWEDAPVALASLAEDHARRLDGAGAAEQMLRAMAAADALGEPAQPTPGRVLILLLHLHRLGAVGAAALLFERFQERLRAAGGEATLIADPHRGFHYAAAGELHRLPPELHPGLRAAIAAACLAGDPAQATPEVLRLALEQRTQCYAYAAMIQPLPILGSFFHAILLSAAPPRRLDRRGLLIAVLVLLLCAVVHWLIGKLGG
jgi:hypothetical protein